ncbi:hypothetical protein GE09DRAFT_1211777 [Coniochaeta sp. 2T2.1]|nr:hypothetical protein GE09DRAFT_1211777 [Coniochaeta sp. 2T2.1]
MDSSSSSGSATPIGSDDNQQHFIPSEPLPSTHQSTRHLFEPGNHSSRTTHHDYAIAIGLLWRYETLSASRDLFESELARTERTWRPVHQYLEVRISETKTLDKRYFKRLESQLIDIHLSIQNLGSEFGALGIMIPHSSGTRRLGVSTVFSWETWTWASFMFPDRHSLCNYYHGLTWRCINISNTIDGVEHQLAMTEIKWRPLIEYLELRSSETTIKIVNATHQSQVERFSAEIETLIAQRNELLNKHFWPINCQLIDLRASLANTETELHDLYHALGEVRF